MRHQQKTPTNTPKAPRWSLIELEKVVTDTGKRLRMFLTD